MIEGNDIATPTGLEQPASTKPRKKQVFGGAVALSLPLILAACSRAEAINPNLAAAETTPPQPPPAENNTSGEVDHPIFQVGYEVRTLITDPDQSIELWGDNQGPTLLNLNHLTGEAGRLFRRPSSTFTYTAVRLHGVKESWQPGILDNGKIYIPVKTQGDGLLENSLEFNIGFQPIREIQPGAQEYNTAPFHYLSELLLQLGFNLAPEDTNIGGIPRNIDVKLIESDETLFDPTTNPVDKKAVAHRVVEEIEKKWQELQQMLSDRGLKILPNDGVSTDLINDQMKVDIHHKDGHTLYFLGPVTLENHLNEKFNQSSPEWERPSGNNFEWLTAEEILALVNSDQVLAMQETSLSEHLQTGETELEALYNLYGGSKKVKISTGAANGYWYWIITPLNPEELSLTEPSPENTPVPPVPAP